jgi:2-dehydro-3-deoxy-D-arabinonate dehydratase
MKLCRFLLKDNHPRVGLLRGSKTVLDLTEAGVKRLDELLAEKQLTRQLAKFAAAKLPSHPLSKVTLLAPVEGQEVWAAGVTYLRSKVARETESDFSATAYDRVYAAKRPEIFFKALPYKVAGLGKPVGIRSDGKWNVPEPELALVFNRRGALVGYTIGNDMSSRDIEGENLLYLPQAKVYYGSCALGPWIVVGKTEASARQWTIKLSIRRRGREVFAGKTSVDRIKRTFSELRDYLFRAQTFPLGAVLLTGTGIVPPDAFTLAKGDEVAIAISGIGTLTNPVAVV